MLKREDLLELGFKELPHPTIMGTIVYELGRNRCISAGCIGAGNEVLYLCKREKVGEHYIYTDLVCIHNRDYDGYLTLDRLKQFIHVFENKDTHVLVPKNPTQEMLDAAWEAPPVKSGPTRRYLFEESITGVYHAMIEARNEDGDDHDN